MQNAPGLILASQSPRRRTMLTWLGIPFTITDGEVDEAPLSGESPAALAMRLARQKAICATATSDRGWVLTADTVVDLDGETLGKPADAAEARRMLARLRRGSHQVHTGIALGKVGGPMALRLVTTDVRMRPYTDAEIAAYIATGDPVDKAGAYAIQHAGFHPVAEVHVCYANVVGLPLCAVVKLLEIDVDVPALCLEHFGYICPRPDEGIGE